MIKFDVWNIKLIKLIKSLKKEKNYNLVNIILKDVGCILYLMLYVYKIDWI